MNDIIVRRTQTAEQPILRRYARSRATPQPTKKYHVRLPEWLKSALAVPLFIVIAVLIQSPAAGQIVATLYVIYAFFRRVPSRTSFALALGSVITMAWLLLIQGNILLAQGFATYTFWLLVAGVSCLGRELKKEGGRVYSIRQNQK
jgi:hypothetical protein